MWLVPLGPAVRGAGVWLAPPPRELGLCRDAGPVHPAAAGSGEQTRPQQSSSSYRVACKGFNHSRLAGTALHWEGSVASSCRAALRFPGCLFWLAGGGHS